MKPGRSGTAEAGVALQQLEKFRQVTRGRASAKTIYHKVVQWVPGISCSRDENAIWKPELMDGIFPLSTNTGLDASAVLRAYKYQPRSKSDMRF